MDGNSSQAPILSGSDLDDLRAARDGDYEAGLHLVARHGPSMVRTARRVLGRYGSGEVDDVVQEAFIAALTTSSLPTVDVGAWLRTITARKALDSLRSSTRRYKERLFQEGHDPVGYAAAGDPGVRLDVLTVRQGLAQLSAADRAVLTLVDLEGRSMAETAKALGLTRVAVRLRAMRARRKLARLLRPEKKEPRRGQRDTRQEAR